MSHPVRIEITGVRYKDGLQLVSGRTQAGESVKDAVRAQGHGVSAHPPAGSIGYVSFLYGRRDMPVLSGIEHPDKTPSDMQDGNVTLYDAKGNKLSLKDAAATLSHDTKVELKVGAAGITIADGKIVLTGEVHLGGEGGQLVHRKGDVDSRGDTATGASSKVYAL